MGVGKQIPETVKKPTGGDGGGVAGVGDSDEEDGIAVEGPKIESPPCARMAGAEMRSKSPPMAA